MWEIRVTPAGDFDNHALEYEHIKVEPLSGAMGAEVVGVRLPELSDAAFEDLKQALYRHKMIYLRDQWLTHAEHEEFGARLGARRRRHRRPAHVVDDLGVEDRKSTRLNSSH